MGLQQFRIPFLRRSPRAWRPQWLPWWVNLRSEADIHPHSPIEHADLFLSYGVATTEIEVLNWLHATICLLKPRCILETGAAGGIGTIAMAAACKANGFGMVHSLEIDPSKARKARWRVKAARLAKYATIHCSDSLEFLRNTNLTFELGFFDSLIQIRTDEYQICHERNILQGIAIFHDTSPTRTQTADDPTETEQNRYRQQLLNAARQPDVTGYFESTLSRGLFIIFPQQIEALKIED